MIRRLVVATVIALTGAVSGYAMAATTPEAAAAGPMAAAPACAPAAPAVPTAAPSTPGLVNLNTASEAELDALPGIGEVTVRSIVAARPIASVDAVAKLPGVRPSNFAKFRTLVTV